MMKIALIISDDPAGRNIMGNLVDNFNFFGKEGVLCHIENNVEVCIHESSKKCIHNENIDKEIEADLFIFPTTHRSKSGIPSLTAHAPGNWAEAELGGEDEKLNSAPASYIKEAVKKLRELSGELHYDVIQEATHHGPYLEKPAMFIEIGCDEKEFKNPAAGKVVAETIMHISKTKHDKYKSAFGIGGLHNMPNYDKLIMKTDIAIGHCCPVYMLKHLTAEKIRRAMEKTWPKAETVAVDWKGLKQHKQRVKEILEEAGIKEYMRLDKLKI